MTASGDVKNVKKTYRMGEVYVQALRGVTLEVSEIVELMKELNEACVTEYYKKRDTRNN